MSSQENTELFTSINDNQASTVQGGNGVLGLGDAGGENRYESQNQNIFPRMDFFMSIYYSDTYL